MSGSSRVKSVSPLTPEEGGPVKRPVVVITLDGHLTENVLRAALATATSAMRGRGETVGLIVDCSTMTGYDTDARNMFVEWNKAVRSRVRRIAIITTNSLWRMVISVMSLASNTEMKAFPGRNDATAWLDG